MKPNLFIRLVAVGLAAAMAAEPALASVASDESRGTSPIHCLLLDSPLIAHHSPYGVSFGSQALAEPGLFQRILGRVSLSFRTTAYSQLPMSARSHPKSVPRTLATAATLVTAPGFFAALGIGSYLLADFSPMPVFLFCAGSIALDRLSLRRSHPGVPVTKIRHSVLIAMVALVPVFLVFGGLEGFVMNALIAAFTDPSQLETLLTVPEQFILSVSNGVVEWATAGVILYAAWKFAQPSGPHLRVFWRTMSLAAVIMAGHAVLNGGAYFFKLLTGAVNPSEETYWNDLKDFLHWDSPLAVVGVIHFMLLAVALSEVAWRVRITIDRKIWPIATPGSA